MPSSWQLQSNQVRRQSQAQAGGQIILTEQEDASLDPRLFLFSWEVVNGAVADAINRHYEDHSAETFEVILPRTGETVVVQWSSGPQIQWSSPVAASLTGEFEEALAHE